MSFSKGWPLDKEGGTSQKRRELPSKKKGVPVIFEGGILQKGISSFSPFPPTFGGQFGARGAFWLFFNSSVLLI